MWKHNAHPEKRGRGKDERREGGEQRKLKEGWSWRYREREREYMRENVNERAREG